MKAVFHFSFFWLLSGICFGGVERFLAPIQVERNSQTVRSKTDALLRGPLHAGGSNFHSTTRNSHVLTPQNIEGMLAESIKHRFQAIGEIVVKITSSWDSLTTKPNCILKLSDISPDELTSSCFVRFSIWESGIKVGDFSLPIRVAQMRDVFVTTRSMPFGAKLDVNDFRSQRVDVLKQHANSVPSSTNLKSFQLDTYLPANAPLKWSNLSKANLTKKGQVVDVYASGNGIYVTMKGLALEDGSVDSLVKVRNLSSDKEFHAKVLSENSVKVSL